jgi:Spy/CpxP family protein refolding chaperone
MNSSLKGKLALAFLLVFVAGAATGVFLGLHHLQHHMIFGPPHSGDVPDRMREHLRRALSLTAEQENKIAPIVDATSTKLETIRVETAERVRTVMEDSKREIAPLLTPEQQKKLEKLESEHRRMMHHHGFLPPPSPKEKPPSPSP